MSLSEGRGASGLPACPVCATTFSFSSQMRRHVRYEHPEVDPNELDSSIQALLTQQRVEEVHKELEEDGSAEEPVMDLRCPWCELDCEEKELYDEHFEEHGKHAFQLYLSKLEQVAALRQDNLDQTDPAAVRSDETEGQNMQCNMCQYTCSGEVTMEKHVDKCHEEIQRQCQLCGEQCMDKGSLHAHLIHHFNGVMECPVCPVRFSIRDHLLGHLQFYHTSEYSIVCATCNMEFNNYEGFEAHQAHKHGIGTKKLCGICDKEFFTVDFEEHLAKHEAQIDWKEGRTHTCNLCQASFLFLSHLYRHKHRDHASSFPFRCNECERRFRTERMLSSHTRGHRYGTHQCPECYLKYRQVDQLNRHLLVAHPEVDGYSCKFCSVILKNYSTYVAHLKFKHPKEAGYDKQPVKCRVCGESFAHKVQWKYHMRNHTHLLQTCRICGITVKNLSMHMNLHTREKKYECGKCGAVYHNKASFHFHVKRVHMGEEMRKHMCSTCDKGFLSPADLRIHIGRVHRGERNYWCNICKKGYKSKVSLTYHQRLHTGERPHRCTLCCRTFRVPSYLKRHVELDHRTQYAGIYYKHGRPKSQEDRQQKSGSRHPTSKEPSIAAMEEAGTGIPEVVQITVPMEMESEVVSAVGTMQEVGSEQLQIEPGVVYVVYEN